MTGSRSAELLWSPPDGVHESSRIGRFLTWLRERGLADVSNYASLYEWSVEDLPGFWRAIWDHFEIEASEQPTAVLGDRRMPGAEWFPGSRLNWAQHVLRAPGLADSDPVVIARSQGRGDATLTVAELREAVRRAASGLRALGIGPGDAVAAYAPNIPETYILLLAAASIGAVFTSCAPEFGSHSVIDRFAQIQPRFLLAVPEYTYGTKRIDRRPELAAITAAVPSIREIVLVDDFAGLDGDDPLTFEQVPFAHPLYVLYSSGTTGLPKPIVHGHGGILLEHVKMLALHHDIGPGDRFFWFSTTGWMMWNYVASGPAVGGTIVMFDGDPGWPDLGALWDFARETGITHFGTSAPFLMACRKTGIGPGDLPALRMLGSTGSPLPSEGFEWVYKEFPNRVQLQSLSGGTDVCTGFVGGAPIVPVYDGLISCRALGAKVEAYAPDGTSLIGELGELVITEPMPSMPVGFWNDPDGARYRASYFEDFPGVWRHGDWIEIHEDGTCAITGRSDATLNRGGVRLGTSEFYAVVEEFAEISDALVVHLDPSNGDGELVLFVTMVPGAELDDDLRARVRARIRGELSPRHSPDEILRVPGIPRTLSGKKCEVPVKRVLSGTPVERAVSRESLANPESMDFFVRLAGERKV